MEYNKKMNKAGSLTIPAALRRELGIDRGQGFKIALKDNGTIELTRSQGTCMFCKSDQNLILHAGRYICGKCIQELSKNAGRSADK